MHKNKYVMFFGAALVYTSFSVYLYLPYLGKFQRFQNLLTINLIFAALGCFILSRRWICGFIESLLAGALYGFGTFTLSLAR